jgi:hypothetical protein
MGDESYREKGKVFDTADHISRHAVSPEEVEEVLFITARDMTDREKKFYRRKK